MENWFGFWRFHLPSSSEVLYPSSSSSGAVTRWEGQALLQECQDCWQGFPWGCCSGQDLGRTLGWQSAFGAPQSSSECNSPRARARAFCKTKARFGLAKAHISLSRDGELGKGALGWQKPLLSSSHLGPPSTCTGLWAAHGSFPSLLR